MIQDPILTSGTLIALLDGVQLGNITFVSPNYVANKSISFKATKTNSELCFNTKQTYRPMDFLSQFQFSPHLDNVSLVLTIPPGSNQTNTSTSNTNNTSNTSTNNTINNTNTSNITNTSGSTNESPYTNNTNSSNTNNTNNINNTNNTNNTNSSS